MSENVSPEKTEDCRYPYHYLTPKNEKVTNSQSWYTHFFSRERSFSGHVKLHVSNCKFYNYLRSGIPWWYGGCYGTGNVFCRYSGAERGVFRAWGPCICQNLILVHSPISRISEDPTLGGWFSELRKYFWSGFVLNHNFRTRSVRLAGFYRLNRHYMIRADLRIDSPPPSGRY